MKVVLKAIMLLAMFAVHEGAARHHQQPKRQKKTFHHGASHQRRERRLLDLDYNERLEELEEYGASSPRAKMDKIVMMTLMSLLVANVLGAGKPNHHRRLKEEKGHKDAFDKLMSGGDITPILIKEKEKIKGFLKKQGVELSEKTSFNDIWPHCKAYCKKNFGLDDESFGMIKPVCKKFFVKMISSKELATLVAPAETPDKPKKSKKAKKARKAKKAKKGKKRGKKLRQIA